MYTETKTPKIVQNYISKYVQARLTYLGIHIGVEISIFIQNMRLLGE